MACLPHMVWCLRQAFIIRTNVDLSVKSSDIHKGANYQSLKLAWKLLPWRSFFHKWHLTDALTSHFVLLMTAVDGLWQFPHPLPQTLTVSAPHPEWASDVIWQQRSGSNFSGNDLVSDGTKPLPELMLTYHQGPVTFVRGQTINHYN